MPATWPVGRRPQHQPQPALAAEPGAVFSPDRMAFGLAGRDGGSALIAVARFADGAEPYAARLVLRDQAAAPASSGPLRRRIDRGPAARPALPRARRPEDLCRRRPRRGQPDLLPKGAPGWAFRFSDDAAANSPVDPRVRGRVPAPRRRDPPGQVEVGDSPPAAPSCRSAALRLGGQGPRLDLITPAGAPSPGAFAELALHDHLPARSRAKARTSDRPRPEPAAFWSASPACS